MKNLISMTDFVLETTKENVNGSYEERLKDTARRFINIINYANFLKQPLELGMFVPCDENGNLFSEFQLEILNSNDEVYELRKAFQQAKERCLFEGFEVDVFGYAYNGEIRISFPNNSTIESYADFDFQLTQTALKQIGL